MGYFDSKTLSAEEEKRIEQNVYFRLHTALVSGLSLLIFGVWLILWSFSAQFPWFIYPIAGLFAGLAVHYYYSMLDRELLSLHFALFCIANTTCFATWCLLGNFSGPVWFVYTFAITAIMFGAHFTINKWGESVHLLLNFHILAFCIMNLIFITAYIDLGKGYPWFIFPTFLTTGLLSIHWSYHFYSTSLLKLHVYTFSNINFMLFFVWAASGQGFPWFTFPLVIWGLVLGVHLFITRRKVPKITVQAPVVVPIEHPAPVSIVIGDLDSPKSSNTGREETVKPISMGSTDYASATATTTIEPVIKETRIEINEPIPIRETRINTPEVKHAEIEKIQNQQPQHATIPSPIAHV